MERTAGASSLQIHPRERQQAAGTELAQTLGVLGESKLEREPTLPPAHRPVSPCARLQERARACVTQSLFIAELHQLQRHKQRGLSPYYYFNYHLN